MSFVRDDHSWTRGVGAIAATDQTSSRRRIAAGRAGRMMAARDSVMARHALGRISTVDDPGRPQPEAPIFNTPGRPPRPAPPTATPPPAGSTPSAPPMPSGPLPAAGQCSADGKAIWDTAGYWRRLRVGEVCATTGTATVDTRVHVPNVTGWCIDAAGKIAARPAGKVTACPIGTAPSAPPNRRQPDVLPPAAPAPASAPPTTQPKPPVISAGNGTSASGPVAAPSDTPPTEPLPKLPDEASQSPGSAPKGKVLVYAALGVGALWLLSRK